MLIDCLFPVFEIIVSASDFKHLRPIRSEFESVDALLECVLKLSGLLLGPLSVNYAPLLQFLLSEHFFLDLSVEHVGVHIGFELVAPPEQYVS